MIGVLITVVILTIAGWVGWQQLHYPAVDAAVTAAKEADDEGNVLYFAGDEKSLWLFSILVRLSMPKAIVYGQQV